MDPSLAEKMFMFGRKFPCFKLKLQRDSPLCFICFDDILKSSFSIPKLWHRYEKPIQMGGRNGRINK